MKVENTNRETGLAKTTTLKPDEKLSYNKGKCASYDLEDYRKQLRVVKIRSPVNVDIFFHSKEQSSIPREISARQRFDGSHEIDVTVEKTIDVNQLKKPCYKPEDHNGETYGEHDYKLMNKMIVERFNCTTPFILPEFRNGTEICLKKDVGLLVQQFLQSSSASFSPNMWTNDYHFIPPCEYHTYTTQETRYEGNYFMNILTMLTIYCREDKMVLS